MSYKLTMHSARAKKCFSLLSVAASIVISNGAAAKAQDCTSLLIDAPGSSAARVCSMKDAEISEKELFSLERKIESQLENSPESSLNRKNFAEAEQDWRRYRGSSCWIDAALASNSSAVQSMCEARLNKQRIEQLHHLLQCVQGEACGAWVMSNTTPKP